MFPRSQLIDRHQQNWTQGPTEMELTGLVSLVFIYFRTTCPQVTLFQALSVTSYLPLTETATSQPSVSLWVPSSRLSFRYILVDTCQPIMFCTDILRSLGQVLPILSCGTILIPAVISICGKKFSWLVLPTSIINQENTPTDLCLLHTCKHSSTHALPPRAHTHMNQWDKFVSWGLNI